jgi:hypothetical protein
MVHQDYYEFAHVILIYLSTVDCFINHDYIFECKNLCIVTWILMCTGCRHSKHANWTIHVTGPGVHKSWVPGHWGSCICMTMFKIFRSSEWNSLNVTFLWLILGWPVDFLKPLLSSTRHISEWMVWNIISISAPPYKKVLFQHIDKCSVVCKAVWPKQGNIPLKTALFNWPPNKVDYPIYVLEQGWRQMV